MALNDFQKDEARRLLSEGRSVLDVYRHLGAKSAGSQSPLEIQDKALGQPPKLSYGQQRRAELGQVISDIPQDIGTGIKQLGQGYLERFSRLKQSGTALARGEQGVLETGAQFAANIAGGAIADPAYQLLRTGASFVTTPEQEQGIGQYVSETAQKIGEKTGLTDWYSNLDDRTKRNVDAALDIADVAPVPILDRLNPFKRAETPTQALPPKQIEEVFTRAEQGDIADATKVVNSTLDDATRSAEVEKLSRAYQDSLVENRQGINRQLQELASEQSRRDNLVTQDDLVRALADEGIVPDIRGRLSDFSTDIRNLQKRQDELFNAYRPILENSRASASIDDFGAQARQAVKDSPQITANYEQTLSQLDRVLNSYRAKYGDTLSASQIDQISRDANRLTKAYRDSDAFLADTYSELGKTARQWLNDNIPDNAFRRTNDEYMRLETLARTAEILNNKQVDVGIIGRALGSYVTTLTGATMGLATGGPLTSVAVGILTKMGGDALADTLRSVRFSPELRTKLQERLSRDQKLAEELKATATTQENKNLIDDLSRMLPPARLNAPRSEVTGGAPIQVGGQTPRGAVNPGITERVRDNAIRQPGGERTPTETERAIRDDADAVNQAVAEMEAEMSGQVRPSVGENFVQTVDGGAYRFNELPSWIPDELRSADLMSRVMTNIVNGKKPRANAGLEIELQKLVESRIKTRVQEIKKGQGDKGIFSGDTAFAVALMAGGTYFLASDDNQLLPVVAIGSMMANPLARKTAIQNAKMMASKGKKLPESYKRKIAEELEQYDTGAVDVKMGKRTESIQPDSVDERLSELQAKNFNGTFTNKDALEAEELMASKGVLIEPDFFNTGTTP